MLRGHSVLSRSRVRIRTPTESFHLPQKDLKTTKMDQKVLEKKAHGNKWAKRSWKKRPGHAKVLLRPKREKWAKHGKTERSEPVFSLWAREKWVARLKTTKLCRRLSVGPFKNTLKREEDHRFSVRSCQLQGPPAFKCTRQTDSAASYLNQPPWSFAARCAAQALEAKSALFAKMLQAHPRARCWKATLSLELRSKYEGEEITCK